METIEAQTTSSILVTGRGASRICDVSHVTFHKWVREGKVKPLAWIESQHGAPVPVFDRAYIEDFAARRKQVA